MYISSLRHCKRHDDNLIYLEPRLERWSMKLINVGLYVCNRGRWRKFLPNIIYSGAVAFSPSKLSLHYISMLCQDLILVYPLLAVAFCNIRGIMITDLNYNIN